MFFFFFFNYIIYRLEKEKSGFKISVACIIRYLFTAVACCILSFFSKSDNSGYS